jgi:Glucoamylase and related glycosyl hydrolases
VNVHRKGLIYKNPRSQEGVELELRGNYCIEDTKIKFKPGQGYLYLLYSKDLRYGLFSKKGEVYSKPYEALERTLTFWKNLIMRSRQFTKLKRFEQFYRRSLSVILGLMYFPTGGLIASPTTSLPEIIGESRNWDYRYVWVRDASYGAEALIKAGLLSRARHVLNFLSSVVDPSSKSFDHPFYGIDGTSPPEEQELEWLRGFQNSRPVRIGNGAYMQVQNDIEGAYMHSLHLYYKESKDKQFLLDNWWAVEAIADWVSNSWYRKSTDIWEQRNVNEHFVHTKIMNWVALDRASKLAQDLGMEKWKDWRNVSEEIRSSVMEEGYSKELNSFVKYYGSQEIDSALLLLPLYGFIEATDPRFLGTLKRIETELAVSSGLFLRYRGDFMGEALNPFTLVTLWMARVYIRLGRTKEASNMLEVLQSCSTDLLLLGEHIEKGTCIPRGNFPHLFPTSGVVVTVRELEESLQDTHLT